MVALSFEYILIICSSTSILLSNSLPIQNKEKIMEPIARTHRREKRMGSPCFTNFDCLRSQICHWNPPASQLAGRCVFQRRIMSRDAVFQNLPSRFRRDAFSNRQRGRTDADETLGDEKNYDAKRYWREGERDVVVPLSREDSEVKPLDQVAESENDIPDGVFPLQHAISGDVDEEGVVIDHFDEQGHPVVVITEDNRGEEADYDTNKDINVFGHEIKTDDDEVDFTVEETKSKNLDDDYDIDRNDGDERSVDVDLMDSEIRLGVASLFGNPWGLPLMTGNPRSMNRVPSNDMGWYLTGDFKVYGAGDQRQGRLKFEHHKADYRGTGIEMDVGVDDYVYG